MERHAIWRGRSENAKSRRSCPTHWAKKKVQISCYPRLENRLCRTRCSRTSNQLVRLPLVPRRARLKERYVSPHQTAHVYSRNRGTRSKVRKHAPGTVRGCQRRVGRRDAIFDTG